MSKVGVFFGCGYEEIEALTVVDLLRRADVDTKMISITKEYEVCGGRHIVVKMDQVISEVNFDELDMIVLPGGVVGTNNLEACQILMDQVDEFYKNGKCISAICAAPSILEHRGILEGKRACAYPSFESHLEGAMVEQLPTIIDGNIITGRGMGCSIGFALSIITYLRGEEVAKKIGQQIMFKL